MEPEASSPYSQVPAICPSPLTTSYLTNNSDLVKEKSRCYLPIVKTQERTENNIKTDLKGWNVVGTLVWYSD